MNKQIKKNAINSVFQTTALERNKELHMTFLEEAMWRKYNTIQRKHFHNFLPFYYTRNC